MNDRISIFEKLARQLVEGAFEHPFGQRKLVQKMAHLIAGDVESTALSSNLVNRYSIQVHPDTLGNLLDASPNLQVFLNEYLSDLAREYNLVPPPTDAIKLVASRETGRDLVSVHAERSSSTRELTIRGFRPSEQQLLSAIDKIDAFLILDGKRHIRVRQAIITIGRHLDSDIILDDSTVSRQHSQLRWQHSRFILFDLGSKAGTLVNNQPIYQHILKNGDVIRIGHSTLIYGEESSFDDGLAVGTEPDDGSTRQLPGRNLE